MRIVPRRCEQNGMCLRHRGIWCWRGVAWRYGGDSSYHIGLSVTNFSSTMIANCEWGYGWFGNIEAWMKRTKRTNHRRSTGIYGANEFPGPMAMPLDCSIYTVPRSEMMVMTESRARKRVGIHIFFPLILLAFLVRPHKNESSNGELCIWCWVPFMVGT